MARKTPTAREGDGRRRSAATRMPAYTPQLATLVAAAPHSDDWLHEVKYDGFRMGLVIAAGKVRLITRSGLDWSERYPGILEAARRLPVSSALLDGEVALELPDGRTSFQGLQNTSRGGGTLVYFVFDLLWLDGEDLASLPLEKRRCGTPAMSLATAPRRTPGHVAPGWKASSPSVAMRPPWEDDPARG
jgi:bifunctional non-homologous end joining protein LigD